MSDPARVEEVFFAALEKGNAAERAAYLDSACGGDTGLRRQVERMLRAHPRVGDFLGTPAAEQLSAPPGRPGPTAGFDGAAGGPDDEVIRKGGKPHPAVR